MMALQLYKTKKFTVQVARKIKKKNREKEQQAVKVMEKGKKETGGIEQTDL